MEVSLDAQTLISLSLRKIHSSRTQRGGIKLHKNLLVSYVLRNARQLYLSERYAELYRRHHHHYHHEGGGLMSGPSLGGSGCASSEMAMAAGAGFVPFHLPADFDGQDGAVQGGPTLRSCALARAAEVGVMPVGASHEEEPLGLTTPPLLFPAGPPSGLGRDSPLPSFYPPRLAPASASPPAPSGLLYASPGSDFVPGPSAPPPSGLPPPAAHCPSRTTVLDLDTHVVTTVENGFLHQDCGCALCPDGCQGPPTATALAPSPGSKRKYHPGHEPETAMAAGGGGGAVRTVEGASLPAALPPFVARGPKRARLEDFNPPTCPEAANISNLISIFGSGFTGLVSRPAAPPVPSMATPVPPPSPPPPPQQTDSEQLLNGQLCSKQALANLSAWTRAIVAF